MIDQLINRAASLHQAGWPAEALQAVEEALARAPDAAEVLAMHAALLEALGRQTEALDSLIRATAAAPGWAGAWHSKGVVLGELGRMAEAVEAFDRALALQPSPQAWNDRAVALRLLGRLDEALASFDRSLEAAPDQEGVRFARGVVLLGLDRAAEALQVFQRAAARCPDSADALAGRASALAALRQFEAALPDFEAALRIAPERADFWFNSAGPLIALQRFDEALEALGRTLALEPGHPGAQIKRGEVLCETGRIAEGMEQIARLAQQVYADGAPMNEEPVRAPEAKHRHDDEQRAWLAARGVAAPRGLHIDGGDRVAGPAVNPANQETVASQWAASEPNMVVIDQLLTPPALEGLQRFCRGSTVWRRSFRQGYLGAFPEHGFACPLLAQIAEELREVFPTVLGQHGLLLTWGFKYDSRQGGILTHADPAAVNVNFWITPDEANLDPESGGMVVWDAMAPPEWEFRRANSDNAAIKSFLEESGARATTIPYRANRAVVFDSNLFHKTDRIEFRDGYENRRINVTMLYGRRNFFNF
jgi:tetratricopeptide (TPR) repeat protein